MRAYRELLALPGVLRLLLSVIPGRLAYSMITLATYFYVHDVTGSITVAGLATGAETIASSVTAGIRGGAIDRFGQTRPLALFVPSWALAVLAMSHQHSGTALVIACTCVGLASPPINLSARPLWRVAVGADGLRTAYALDTTVMSAMTVVGPFVVTAIALQASPAAALAATAVSMVTGGALMITMPLSRAWRPEVVPSITRALLANRAFRLLAVEGMIFGVGWGLLEISIPSVATLSGRPGAAAPLMAALAAAGIVGGLVLGAARIPVSPLRGFRYAQVALAVSCLPLAATSPGWSMGVVLALMGLCVGFAQVYHWEVVEAVRPHGAATSAQAWLWTMEGSMLAVGTAAGGYIVEHVSPRLALAGPAVFVTAATVFVWVVASSAWQEADRPLTDLEVADALADLEATSE